MTEVGALNTEDDDTVGRHDEFEQLRGVIRASQHQSQEDAALPALALPNDPLRNGVEAFIARIGRGESVRRTAALPPDLQHWAAATDERFTWLPQMRGLLRDHWGHEAFRGLQLPVINALMSGEDVFAVMPTGSGKSLCYQLPAMVRDGTTIVVSPLLSLMEDQVSSLQSRGIAAARLGSDTTQAATKKVFQDLAGGEIQLLYVSPERMVAASDKTQSSGKLGSVLTQLYDSGRMALLVIDEAHCVSQWGLDFRSDYRKLSFMRARFRGVPMLAVTASATTAVEKDVLKSLRMQEAVCFHDTFDRANLFMEVRPKQSEDHTIQELVDLVSAPTSPTPACGVVYVLARREVDRVCQSLCELGVPSCPYHAGLPAGVRRESFTKWMHGECQLIVATVAFGMGIDKRDVRFVFHIDMPSSIEKYHQEIGRAGRDGRPCRCILWFSRADVKRNKEMSQKQYEVKRCEDAGKFFGDETCRHAGLLKHFGEKPSFQNCGACDVCCRQRFGLAAQAQAPQRDVSPECQKLLQLAESLLKNGVTAAKLRDAARKRKVDGTKAFSAAVAASEHAAALKEFSHSQVEEMISKLLQNKVLTEYKDKMFGKGKGKFKVLRLKLGPNADKLRKGSLKVHLPLPGGSDRSAIQVEESEPSLPPGGVAAEAEAEPAEDVPLQPPPQKRRLRRITQEAEPSLPFAGAPYEAADAEAEAVEVPPLPQSPPKRRRLTSSKAKAVDKAAARKETSPLAASGRSLRAAKARLFSRADDPIEEEEEEAVTPGMPWPPDVPDSSGDELVWVGGGEELQTAPSPSRKRREARHEAATSPSKATQPPLQPSAATSQSSGRRLPWPSHGATRPPVQLPPQPPHQTVQPPPQPPLQPLHHPVQVAALPAAEEGATTSPSSGRRLPWPSHGATRPPVQLPPQPPQQTVQPPPQPPLQPLHHPVQVAALPAAEEGASRALPSRAARRNALRVAPLPGSS
ncbi:RECQL2 [Symbiodinium sp. CCMP2456]|nr:RECQL2 [Symbiodinium sp. CCMP2456]